MLPKQIATQSKRCQCAPLNVSIFSVSVRGATKHDRLIKCPPYGMTSTDGVAQMLKPAAGNC